MFPSTKHDTISVPGEASNGRGYTVHYAPVRFLEMSKPGEIKKVKIVDNKIEFLVVEPA